MVICSCKLCRLYIIIISRSRFFTEQNANAAGPRPRVAHVSHSVVVGSFGGGGGDPNVGGSRDISRVCLLSAVLYKLLVFIIFISFV